MLLIASALLGVIAMAGALLAGARFGELHFWTPVGAAIAIAGAVFATRPTRSLLPWIGATAGVLVAPFLVNLFARPAAPAPASARTLEALIALSQRDPLIAVATGWRPVRSAAVSGSWSVGPRLEPGGTYSLVALASSHGPGGVAPTAADERCFTSEAFAQAWRSVEANGSLAWLAADEAVFTRGMLQLADVLAAETKESSPLARRAFALRVAEGAPATEWRFLLLISREPASGEDVARLASLARTLPVRVLFGAGVPSRGPWSVLAEGKPVAHARDALRRDLSRRAGKWLDLSAASTDRPVFLRLDPSPPATRVITGVGVVGLLSLLLLPLPHRRSEEAADTMPWPLPLLLATFAALGAAPLFAVAALVGKIVALGGSAVVDPVVAIAAGVAGFAAGVHFDLSRRAATALGLAAAAASVALHFAPLAASPARELLLATAAVLFGVASAALGNVARRSLAEAMPDVLPWAMRLSGFAALVAAAAAPWLVQWKGFAGLAIAAAITYVVGSAAPALAQVKTRK